MIAALGMTDFVLAPLILAIGIYAVLYVAAYIGSLLAHLVKPLVHA